MTMEPQQIQEGVHARGRSREEEREFKGWIKLGRTKRGYIQGLSKKEREYQNGIDQRILLPHVERIVKGLKAGFFFLKYASVALK